MKGTPLYLWLLLVSGTIYFSMCGYLKTTRLQTETLTESNRRLSTLNDSLIGGINDLRLRIDSLSSLSPGGLHLEIPALLDRLEGSVFKIAVCYRHENVRDGDTVAIEALSPDDSLTWCTGTAFCFLKAGFMLTNHHILRPDALHALVEDVHGNIYEIDEVLFSNKLLDYTVFALAEPAGVPLNLASYNPPVGYQVMTIGNPMNLNFTPSQGMVTGYRLDSVIIQIDIPVTHGNSGGPLIDANGLLSGIVFGGMDNNAQLNFAVNIRSIMDDIVISAESRPNTGNINQPYFDLNSETNDVHNETMPLTRNENHNHVIQLKK